MWFPLSQATQLSVDYGQIVASEDWCILKNALYTCRNGQHILDPTMEPAMNIELDETHGD